MSRSFAVIGVGNMAKSILAGIASSRMELAAIYLFDTNEQQYESFCHSPGYHIVEDIVSAVEAADCILLSVKPQNFSDILEKIKQADGYASKLYISIAAGIASETISSALNGACVIRVLPNLPMTIGMGVSLICKNDGVDSEDMTFVQDVFRCAGSICMIEEDHMNRMIGVTSSSPAYVFQMVRAMYQGALQQGLSADGLIDVICDVLIGSATLLKRSGENPDVLISRVASKGGTTEQALNTLNEHEFDRIVADAMKACTRRADELGKA